MKKIYVLAFGGIAFLGGFLVGKNLINQTEEKTVPPVILENHYSALSVEEKQEYRKSWQHLRAEACKLVPKNTGVCRDENGGLHFLFDKDDNPIESDNFIYFNSAYVGHGGDYSLFSYNKKTEEMKVIGGESIVFKKRAYIDADHFIMIGIDLEEKASVPSQLLYAVEINTGKELLLDKLASTEGSFIDCWRPTQVANCVFVYPPSYHLASLNPDINVFTITPFKFSFLKDEKGLEFRNTDYGDPFYYDVDFDDDGEFELLNSQNISKVKIKNIAD